MSSQAFYNKSGAIAIAGSRTYLQHFPFKKETGTGDDYLSMMWLSGAMVKGRGVTGFVPASEETRTTL